MTSICIYWDEIFLAPDNRAPETRLTTARQLSADLRFRGFSAEVTPDGREPFGYDYARVSEVSPWKALTGRYTRFGDVRELVPSRLGEPSADGIEHRAAGAKRVLVAGENDR